MPGPDPIVVAAGIHPQAEWRITEDEDGVKALQYVGDQLIGFALVGDAVAEKQALSKQLPDLL